MIYDPVYKVYKETFETSLSVEQIQEKISSITENPKFWSYVNHKPYEGEVKVNNFRINQSGERSSDVFPYYVNGKMLPSGQGTSIELNVERGCNLTVLAHIPKWAQISLVFFGLSFFIWSDIQKHNGAIGSFQVFQYVAIFLLFPAFWILGKYGYRNRALKEIKYFREFLSKA